MTKRPILPFILGLAGLIPFVFFALLAVLGLGVDYQTSSLALIGYGAVILSFLGGARWGTEIHRQPEAPNELILSFAMLPALAGWAAILLWINDQWNVAYGLLATGLALQMMWDVTAIRKRTYPRWYLPLRAILSSVAVFSLLAAIFL